MNLTRCTRWALALIAVLGWQAWAWAEEAAPAPVTPLPEMGTSVMRVLGALALVLAIFFAGVWLYRNWQRVLGPKGRAPKLSVIEVKSLGNRHALYVVGYERQRMLVASSPTGMTLLSQLPEADPNESALPAPASFAESLQKVLERKT